MDALLRDIRYGVRTLLQRPAVTLIMVVTLALGIGATTAIFSVVNTVLLRPLPYPNADRIVAIEELSADGKHIQVTPANFLDWHAQGTVFENLAAIFTRTSNLALADHAERIDLAVASANFFHVFGVEAQCGRLFTPEDGQAGHAAIVVISNDLWHKRFGADPGVVGKAIILDGKSYAVSGVAPEFYLSSLQDTFDRMSFVIRTDVEPASLVASVRRAVEEVDKTQPVSDVRTMENIVADAVIQPRFNLFLLGLFGGIALLLSAAGIYGVTAYTVTQRTHEVGIRMALGAQVGDVLRLILIQGVRLIGSGIVIGLIAALVLTRLLRSLLFGVSTTDPLTFAGISLLLLLVAVLACYIPARRATRVDPLIALRYE